MIFMIKHVHGTHRFVWTYFEFWSLWVFELGWPKDVQLLKQQDSIKTYKNCFFNLRLRLKISKNWLFKKGKSWLENCQISKNFLMLLVFWICIRNYLYIRQTSKSFLTLITSSWRDYLQGDVRKDTHPGGLDRIPRLIWYVFK